MHLAKYHSAAKGHMLQHYARESQCYSNKSIDSSRTHLNYNLAEHKLSQNEFIEKRIEELNKAPKSNAVLFCDWCVTLPQNVPLEHSKEFFERIYDFFSDRYGTENIVSAYVHMDENRPHMHFCFMPIIDNRLCAREVIDRFELIKAHKDAQDYLVRNGMCAELLNGNTAKTKLQREYEKTEDYKNGLKKFKRFCSAKQKQKACEREELKQSCRNRPQTKLII